jgi:hypothetical protein
MQKNGSRTEQNNEHKTDEIGFLAKWESNPYDRSTIAGFDLFVYRALNRSYQEKPLFLVPITHWPRVENDSPVELADPVFDLTM